MSKDCLIDWHTNLWLPEHLGEESREEMGARTGGQMDASPPAHEKLIAGTAEKFIVLALRHNQLGIRVPNDFVAEYCARFPGRAYPFMGIDCTDPMAPRQVEQAVKELGVKGIKLSPVYAGFDPWCDTAMRVYKVAERLKVPLLWHQSAAYAAKSTLEWGNPILLDKIGREFPKLRMVVAHIGQPWTGETVVLLRKHKQIFTDLSARYYRKWQCYNALMLALDYKVTDQILFGSDFPIQTTQQALDSFRAINDWGPGVAMPKFPPEIIEDIIYRRPIELLWPEG
ncbi:MAG: amidohydrolase family protein [Alphaproteobacteria bacterium]